MQSNPSCEQLNKRVELYCTTNKAWRYVFIPRLPLRLEIGNGDSWSRITASFSRKSRISNFCHRYPKHNSLSQSASVPFGKFRFPASSQIPHPSTFSRIPHCLLVKSRIPSTFSRIPHCLLVKSRIASRFSRIPHCLLVKSRIPSMFSRIPQCLLVKSRIPKYPSRPGKAWWYLFSPERAHWKSKEFLTYSATSPPLRANHPAPYSVALLSWTLLLQKHTNPWVTSHIWSVCCLCSR